MSYTISFRQSIQPNKKLPWDKKQFVTTTLNHYTNILSNYSESTKEIIYFNNQEDLNEFLENNKKFLSSQLYSIYEMNAQFIHLLNQRLKNMDPRLN